MIDDYCGYCGKDFRRARSESKEICKECLADPDVARQYESDSEYEAAEHAHDEDHRREARFYE